MRLIPPKRQISLSDSFLDNKLSQTCTPRVDLPSEPHICKLNYLRTQDGLNLPMTGQSSTPHGVLSATLCPNLILSCCDSLLFSLRH